MSFAPLAALPLIIASLSLGCGIGGPSYTVCGLQLTAVQHTRSGGARLDSAALLQNTIAVDSRVDSTARCLVADGDYSTLSLHIHDRVQLVPNSTPTLSPASSGVVTVSTAPGPAGQFGGLTTPHVIVTLTAVKEGSVSLHWEA